MKNKQLMKKTKSNKNILIYFKGIAMGAADIVPGVSGGTIAFITGIYETLIESINNINFSLLSLFKEKGLKAVWQKINGTFLLFLFLGIATSVFLLASTIEFLLAEQPILLFSFFLGLIIASIYFIIKQIKWTLLIFVFLALGILISYGVTLIPTNSVEPSNLYLFFSGFIAIMAMVLPGVSGSYLFLILGVYPTVLSIIKNTPLALIDGDWELLTTLLIKMLFLGLGILIGLKSFAVLLKWMFKNYKNQVLSLLTGFMIGALNKIWPWQEVLSSITKDDGEIIPTKTKAISPFLVENNQLFFAILLILIGFFIVFFIQRLGKKV